MKNHIRSLFVTGIGTGIGKTVVSAVLCEALKADYWKPIQAGNIENTDSDVVRALVSNTNTAVHSEAFCLSTPCSPHLAAKIDQIEIEIAEISLPSTSNGIVVEGAGGLLVPINQKKLVIDLIGHLALPVVLVSKNYLGSINHTLLSIEALRARSIEIAGIVFCGMENPETEKIIEEFSAVRVLGRVFEEPRITAEIIKKYAAEFRRNIDELS